MTLRTRSDYYSHPIAMPEGWRRHIHGKVLPLEPQGWWRRLITRRTA